MRSETNIIRQLFVLITVVLLLVPSAFAEKPTTLCVQSINIKPYNRAVDGFKDVFTTKLKRIILAEHKEMDLIEYANSVEPEIILAVGLDALKAVKEIKHIPILYLMMENPSDMIEGSVNITGVNMRYPEEQQVSIIIKLLPKTENLMLLYNPDNKQPIVEKIREELSKEDVDLIAKKIYSPKEVLPTLMATEKKVLPDVFLMIPDTTVINSVNTEAILLFSLKHKIPVVTFAPKYLKIGALMAITFDEYQVGNQVGKMAQKVLEKVGREDLNSGKEIDVQTPIENIEEAKIIINQTIMDKFKIVFNKNVDQNLHYMN